MIRVARGGTPSTRNREKVVVKRGAGRCYVGRRFGATNIPFMTSGLSPGETVTWLGGSIQHHWAGRLVSEGPIFEDAIFWQCRVHEIPTPGPVFHLYAAGGRPAARVFQGHRTAKSTRCRAFFPR